ncbi:MAG: AsmA family protein [Methylovirgula sp.]
MNETAHVTARPARRVKMVQVSWLIGGLVASAGVAAVAASFLLTAAVLNSDLAAQIRRTTGFSTLIHGGARFALFPQPHIEIENISFADPKAALRIDAASFTGYLRVLPLFAGRVEVGHAVLYQPKMIIGLDDRPMTPESAIGRAAGAKSASPEAAAIDRAKLGILDIVDGSARLQRHGAHQDIFIDDINVTANWRSLDASATLTGAFSFSNVPMQLKAWLAQPVELLRGGDSAGTLQLESDAVKILASGRISAAPHIQYGGSLAVSAPSLRALAQLAGFSFAKHGRFANFDLHCDADVNSNTAALTNLHLRLDGNDYEGTLAVLTDGQTPRLSGTLATNLLDVTPFLEGLPRPRGAYGRWNDEGLELADLGFTNLDLRLSASRLRLNDMEIKDAALSLLTRPGFIDLALAEATADGGTIRGRLSLSTQGKTLDLRASASAKGVDLQPMLHGQTIRHPLSGSLSGSIMVESKGGSFDQLMRALSGHGEVDVTNGQLIGVDLATALHTSGSSFLTTQGDPTQSVTNFDRASFGLQIAHGIAKIADGHIDADGTAVSFGGSADLGDRNLDLWALAQPRAAADKADNAGTPLRLGIKGPWDNVNLIVDRPPPRPSTPPPVVRP